MFQTFLRWTIKAFGSCRISFTLFGNIDRRSKMGMVGKLFNIFCSCFSCICFFDWRFYALTIISNDQRRQPLKMDESLQKWKTLWDVSKWDNGWRCDRNNNKWLYFCRWNLAFWRGSNNWRIINNWISQLDKEESAFELLETWRSGSFYSFKFKSNPWNGNNPCNGCRLKFILW